MALIKCPKCEKDISLNETECPYCGCPVNAKKDEELQEINTSGLGEGDKEIKEIVKNIAEDKIPKNYCIYCGGQIIQDKGYCKKCGKSSLIEGQRHCIDCGEILKDNQKFCMNCGKRVNNVILLQSVGDKIKKADKRKKAIGIIVVLVILLFFVSKPVLSKILVSTEEYLKEANYEKAYNKAKTNEQKTILLENLIAKLSADAKDNLKNPDSFKLEKAFYESKESEIVLQIQGTNSYGGTISNYWHYTYSEEEKGYQLNITISDFEGEEIYSWDDLETAGEKFVNAIYTDRIAEIISDQKNQLDVEIVKRINDLNQQGILKDVELIPEIKSLYPNDKDEA